MSCAEAKLQKRMNEPITVAISLQYPYRFSHRQLYEYDASVLPKLQRVIIEYMARQPEYELQSCTIITPRADVATIRCKDNSGGARTHDSVVSGEWLLKIVLSMDVVYDLNDRAYIPFLNTNGSYLSTVANKPDKPAMELLCAFLPNVPSYVLVQLYDLLIESYNKPKSKPDTIVYGS